MWTQLGDRVTMNVWRYVCTAVCAARGRGHDGKAEGEYYCRRAPDASWQGAQRRIDGERVEQFLLFIAEPTETIFATKKHTGLVSYTSVWI